MQNITNPNYLIPGLVEPLPRAPLFLRVPDTQLQLMRFDGKEWAKVNTCVPCPICKRSEGRKRCVVSRDGEAVICRFIPGEKVIDGGWLHECVAKPFSAQRIIPDQNKFRNRLVSDIAMKYDCTTVAAIEILGREDEVLASQMAAQFATNAGLQENLEIEAALHDCDLLHAYRFWQRHQTRSNGASQLR